MEYHMDYDSNEEFLEEWGEPDSGNVPVQYCVDTDEGVQRLIIAQPRKGNFAHITIKGAKSIKKSWISKY